mgnify:CR=1 FL=1|jgi:hypothetical protein
MSDLEANVVSPKAGELLAVRITEDNLRELASRFSHTLFTRTEGKTAIFWCGIYGYPGETIVFSEAGGIIGIYDDEDIEKLFNLTGEKRPLRRPWPTAPLIIIHYGHDAEQGRINPGTVALRDSEGDYFTRNYGFLCKHIDKIDNWTPIDPSQGAS